MTATHRPLLLPILLLPCVLPALFSDHMVIQSADGLKARDDRGLTGFAIAGKDRKWRWAKTEIDGGKVVVWHPNVDAPAAVRYAWADNPDCNLVNSAGLPASPFRTDDWQK